MLLQEKKPINSSPSFIQLKKQSPNKNNEDAANSINALKAQVTLLEEGMAAQTAKVDELLSENEKIKQYIQKNLK
jgi:hypothetical protein